jgi:hypothetical protein
MPPGDPATASAAEAGMPVGTTVTSTPAPATPVAATPAGESAPASQETSAAIDAPAAAVASSASQADDFPAAQPLSVDAIVTPSGADLSAGGEASLSSLEAELRETMATPAPSVVDLADGSAPTGRSVVPAAVSGIAGDGDAPSSRWAGLLFKPLDWLNAPLDALGPRARETVGKIAIVTAFNAAVVLVYVMFFRGR